MECVILIALLVGALWMVRLSQRVKHLEWYEDRHTNQNLALGAIIRYIADLDLMDENLDLQAILKEVVLYCRAAIEHENK